jgi:putative ABC transport system permease protein
MATVAGVTALAIGSASDSAQAQRDYARSAPMGTARITSGTEVTEADWDALAAVLEREAPGRPVHRLQGNTWTDTDVQDEVAVVADGCAGDVTTCRWVPVTSGSVTTYYGELLVTDAAGLRAISTEELSDEAYAALDAGRAVVFGSGAVDATGQVAVAGAQYDGVGGSTQLGTEELPATEVPLPEAGPLGVELPAHLVIPPVLAERLPLPWGRRRW